MDKIVYDPLAMIRARRAIWGMSAVLLPFTEAGAIDWDGFCAHVARTVAAGIVPAVNMDTGYVNLISADERLEVLRLTQSVMSGREFVAGAFVADQVGASYDEAAYFRQIEIIKGHGGTPVIFQSYGLTGQASDQVLEAYRRIGEQAERFIAFELGTMFAPFGRIYDLDTYEGLLQIEACIGAKHSSLSRDLEWQRLALRDQVRPDFHVFTGNDLAIDMMMYGSDYLLGISTFAPDLFARRDAYWRDGDPRFYELNDGLQYLGQFAFRPPVPAYKHSAAQFLKLRGWIGSDTPHPRGSRRPEGDVDVLREIGRLLGVV
ncbi:MAG TPA: dihydrodipicolinate synthase family protein [Phototrophicaceae bacterium]|nr:dihydrodipicolinate synthase family protein [Phototrophicaceae bacterium]